MADYIIRDTTLTAIADSIRAKTGKSDKIAPENMPAEIEGITGGGSAEGCVTVTFMNGDTVLFTRPVYKGDDCPDPIAQGHIKETPTKESTVDKVFAYNGWAAADGGAADSTVLRNITADKTLYAAYAESVRMYTVNFYDGETLVHTEQVAYGGSSGYKHQKTDLMFKQWIPAPTNITGDMDCYGEWVAKPAFATISWAEIAAISESGQAADSFNIGDERDVTVTYANGTTEVVTLQIAGFDALYTQYDATDETRRKTAGIALVAKNVLAAKKQMQGSAYKNTYYTHPTQSCYLRDWLNGDFYNALPTDFAQVLKDQLRCLNGSEALYTKIMVPFARNMVGDTSYLKESYNNAPYTFYPIGYANKLPLFGTPSLCKKYNSEGTACQYWLADGAPRFTASGTNGVSLSVRTDGSVWTCGCTMDVYVAPMFAI